MTRCACILTVLPWFAVAVPAAAHPFHGADSGFVAGLAHPLLGPDHLLAMVAVGAWAAQIGGRALWAIPVAFLAVMLVGGALGMAGFPLLHTEPIVAASGLALGLLVCGGWKTDVAAGTLLAACFALFHGMAHATGPTPLFSSATYALGVTLATANLHLLGIGATSLLQRRSRLAGVPIALAGCWVLAGTLT